MCVCVILCMYVCSIKDRLRFNQQSNYAGGPDLEHRQVTTNG